VTHLSEITTDPQELKDNNLSYLLVSTPVLDEPLAFTSGSPEALGFHAASSSSALYTSTTPTRKAQTDCHPPFQFSVICIYVMVWEALRGSAGKAEMAG